MNVTFEHPTIIFDDKIAEIIIEFVNHILYADSEKTLRQIVADFANKYDLDRYFVYGFGSHHLWLKQRKITNPDITFEYRILIVMLKHNTMVTKMTARGVSTTITPGTEQYEAFYTGYRTRSKEYCQYDYRHTDGELFSCVADKLSECRHRCNEWLSKKK